MILQKRSICSSIVPQSKRFVHYPSRSPLESCLHNELMKKISCYKLGHCEPKQGKTLERMTSSKGTLIQEVYPEKTKRFANAFSKSFGTLISGKMWH
ncbi:hypothetical protein V1478_001700 [Vespula squamosa]|uniref:Uncharacterized protein n=1 Tax=Vespula squamosa TaxID=30214 RepID=A0ABD2BXZ2_VESSQ